MIEFTQSGQDLMLDTDGPVQFSRDTPVQVTLTDDTFTSADDLSLNFIPEDGRKHAPARVPLKKSDADGVYTGVIGKAAALVSGITSVALGGIVTSTGQVITSRAERVMIDRSVDPEQGALADPATLTEVVDSAVDKRLAWRQLCEADLLEDSESLMMSFRADWVSELFVRFFVAGDSDTSNPGIRIFIRTANGDFEIFNCECDGVSPDEALLIRMQGKHIGDIFDDIRVNAMTAHSTGIVGGDGSHGFATWTNPVTITIKPYVSGVKFVAGSYGELWGR